MAGAIGKCPMCGKPTVDSVKPFCSARCANLDLGQWLSEGYKIPVDETDEDGLSLPNGENGEETN